MSRFKIHDSRFKIQNLKAVFCCVLLCFAFFYSNTPQAFAELKIGYIRPQYIFNKFEPYKEAQKELEEFEKKEVEKLKKLGEEFQREYEDAGKQAIFMSDETKEKKYQELQIKRENLDRYYDDLYKQPSGKLFKKQEELIQPIINRINGVLTRIGKEEGYDYIFDGEGPILYANEKYDISDYILEELEKDIPTK